jgi:hypothetical protein
MAPPTVIDIEAVTDTQAIIIPELPTINGVSERRAKAGKLVAGTAAYTSSDFFKSSVSHLIISRSLTVIAQTNLPDHRKAESKEVGS